MVGGGVVVFAEKVGGEAFPEEFVAEVADDVHGGHGKKKSHKRIQVKRHDKEGNG